MTEPCKPTGSRKLKVTLSAMLLITAGYGGTLYLTHLSGVEPASFAANYLTFVGAIFGALGAFVGTNAAVHIAGKDPQG